MGQINVSVRLEGLSDKTKFILDIPIDTTIKGLFDQLVSKYGEEIRVHLYDSQTNELGTFMVVLNSRMVRLPDEFDVVLKDNDKAYIISPMGGG